MFLSGVGMKSTIILNIVKLCFLPKFLLVTLSREITANFTFNIAVYAGYLRHSIVSGADILTLIYPK